jgi:hypothetical protein
MKTPVAVSITGETVSSAAPRSTAPPPRIEEANAAGETPRIELAMFDDASNADRGRTHRKTRAACNLKLVLPERHILSDEIDLQMESIFGARAGL